MREIVPCGPNEHRLVRGGQTIATLIANEKVLQGFTDALLDQAERTASLPGIEWLGFTPDAHVGKGVAVGTVLVTDARRGVVSPTIVGTDIGCGMFLTTLPVNLDHLTERSIRRLLHEIEARVPVGKGQSRRLPITEEHFREGLTHGPAAVAGKIGLSDEIGSIEDAGVQVDRDPEEVLPQTALEAGLKTLGTLGGGNHFLELQTVEVAPEQKDVAGRWGLMNGGLVLMGHTGSRALGARVADHYTRLFRRLDEAWGIRLPDADLSYAPLETSEGRAYLAAMQIAGNMAKLNRALIRVGVREAIRSVLGTPPDQVRLVYDLSHNYAFTEYEGKAARLVHRKGATRALPAGHHLNPKTYRDTGHPVLIPGSMGSPSYVLVAQPGAARTYFSVNHGAGRAMSRGQARRELTVADMEASLCAAHAPGGKVLLHTDDAAHFIDEAPQAYKAIDDIIDSVVGAGLARVVARCRPIAVVKGKD